MNHTKLSLLILALSVSVSCQQKQIKLPPNETMDVKPKSDKLETVSLISLIANPENYDRKRVRIIGYLNLEFEGNALYMHKEDYEKSIEKNGLWVDKTGLAEKFPNLKQYTNQYVLIEATFNAGDKGHMGMWSGALTNINRLDLR